MVFIFLCSWSARVTGNPDWSCFEANFTLYFLLILKIYLFIFICVNLVFAPAFTSRDFIPSDSIDIFGTTGTYTFAAVYMLEGCLPKVGLLGGTQASRM